MKSHDGPNLRCFSIALGVAIVHLLSGIDIFVGRGMAHVVSTTPLAYLHHLVGHPYYVAVILIGTALLAVVPFAVSKPSHLFFMLMIGPQQLLLLTHLVSAVTAIATGTYPDGYAPAGGSMFIFADQSWLLMVIVLHSLEYLVTL